MGLRTCHHRCCLCENPHKQRQQGDLHLYKQLEVELAMSFFKKSFILLSLGAVLGFLTLGWANAQETGTQNVAMIIDASGSMTGKLKNNVTRMDAAKLAVKSFTVLAKFQAVKHRRTSRLHQS